MILWLTQLAFAQETTELPTDEEVIVFGKAMEPLPVEEKKTEVWFECQPMSGMLNLWKTLPVSMRENAGGFANVSLEQFTQAGGVPDGLFRAYGAEKVIMEMNYKGSDEQLISFLEMIQPDSVIWKQEADLWLMELPSDRWVVRKDKDLLRLHSANTSVDLLKKPEVQGVLNVGEGCVMAVENGPPIQRLNAQMSGGIFLPFETGPVEVAFKPENKLPSVLHEKGEPPIEVLYPDKPFAVMTLGFPLLDMLDDPEFAKRMELTEKEITKMKKRLRLQPGSLLLLHDMNVKQDPKVSVALGLENRFGKPQWNCLIWRGLKKSLKQQKKDFIVLDKRILSIDVDGAPIYFGVIKGRLYASTYRDGINQLMAGEGSPVVDEEFGNYASQLPLAVQVNIPPMVGMMLGGLSKVELGLKGADEFAVISLNANISAQQILGLLVSQTTELAGREPQKKELNSYQKKMMLLAAKEHQHKAQTGAYRPVGQTGGEMRVVEDIQLPLAESAFELGWLSEDDGNIYWIEVTETGFEVHGLVTSEIESFDELHVVKRQDGSFEILN